VNIWLGIITMAVVVFTAALLTLVTAFFLDFPVVGLGAAVGFGSDFSGLAVFRVAVTVACSAASGTCCGG